MNGSHAVTMVVKICWHFNQKNCGERKKFFNFQFEGIICGWREKEIFILINVNKYESFITKVWDFKVGNCDNISHRGHFFLEPKSAEISVFKLKFQTNFLSITQFLSSKDTFQLLQLIKINNSTIPFAVSISITCDISDDNLCSFLFIKQACPILHISLLLFLILFAFICMTTSKSALNTFQFVLWNTHFSSFQYKRWDILWRWVWNAHEHHHTLCH